MPKSFKHDESGMNKWPYLEMTSSAMPTAECYEEKEFKLPPDDPNKCKARVVRHHQNPNGNHIVGYYFREQCSRDKGYGPNGEYCWQHSKSMAKKFGI